MTMNNNEPTFDQRVRARMLAFVMAGVVLVTASIVVARYYELGRHIGFDFQGERVTGTAEPNEDGSYRLRYETADGIHALSYRGGFGLQTIKDNEFEVQLARDRERPGRFQPSGLSYLPGALTLIIFCSGMACMLHARRVVILHRRSEMKR